MLPPPFPQPSNQRHLADWKIQARAGRWKDGKISTSELIIFFLSLSLSLSLSRGKISGQKSPERPAPTKKTTPIKHSSAMKDCTDKWRETAVDWRYNLFIYLYILLSYCYDSYFLPVCVISLSPSHCEFVKRKRREEEMRCVDVIIGSFDWTVAR